MRTGWRPVRSCLHNSPAVASQPARGRPIYSGTIQGGPTKKVTEALDIDVEGSGLLRNSCSQSAQKMWRLNARASSPNTSGMSEWLQFTVAGYQDAIQQNRKHIPF